MQIFLKCLKEKIYFSVITALNTFYFNMLKYVSTIRIGTCDVNGWREAGNHDMTFDASNLAAGLYFCPIRAGEFTAGGKMVLMK